MEYHLGGLDVPGGVEVCFFCVEVYIHVVSAELVACGMKRLVNITDKMDKEANSELGISESFTVGLWDAFRLSRTGLLCTNGIST